jgi:hypothetical protein
MTEERYTLSEAATLLGITPDALRQRIRRGRYHTEKEAGRVYVYLDTDRTQTERPTEQGTDVLIPELRSRIESLERQLDLEREANRENRRLLAAALERDPPQLEAPGDPSVGSHESMPLPEMNRPAWVRFAELDRRASLGFGSLLGLIFGTVLFGTSTVGAIGGFVSSIISATNGDQLVALVSAIIGVAGTISATLLGIFWSRRWRE